MIRVRILEAPCMGAPVWRIWGQLYRSRAAALRAVRRAGIHPAPAHLTPVDHLTQA